MDSSDRSAASWQKIMNYLLILKLRWYKFWGVEVCEFNEGQTVTASVV